MSVDLEARPTGLSSARADFPALAQQVHGRPLVYLDSAATSQKPQAVVDAVRGIYERDCANVHRGVYQLAQRATESFEAARTTIADFLSAPASDEIVFTRGTTEAINLVARSFARPRLGPGTSVLLTGLEHHSNIVPWQLVCEETGAELRVAPLDERGEVVFEELDRLLDDTVQIAAISHVSNALGTINPVAEIIALARQRGVPVLLDGAQAVPHLPVDVAALGCDFYAFSGHKVFGPTGIGVLWGRGELLSAMPPYQGGGEMIRSVRFEGSTFAPPPHRFEAGTPNIAGAVGLAAALDYLAGLDPQRVEAHEAALLDHATERLEAIPGLRLIGTARRKVPVLSFVLDGVHPHDIGTFLDQEGIAVRAGHHCAQPVMEHFGVPATTRASFAFYNTHEEVEALAAGLDKVRAFFA